MILFGMRTRRWQWIQTLASAMDLTTIVSRIGSMTLTIESGVGIQNLHLHRLLTGKTLKLALTLQ